MSNLLSNLIDFHSINQFFSLVVPGFVLLTFIRLFITTNKIDITRDIIYWIIATAFYSAISKCFLPIPYKCLSFLSEPLFHNFIYPLFLGYIFIFCYRKNIFSAFFNFISLGNFLIEDCAWDVIFSKDEEYYVYVVLNDGSEIYGLYQRGSYASSDREFRDIYLSETFIKINDVWTLSEANEGVWMNCSQIKYMKLITAT